MNGPVFRGARRAIRYLFARNTQINANPVRGSRQHNGVLTSFVSRKNGFGFSKNLKTASIVNGRLPPFAISKLTRRFLGILESGPSPQESQPFLR
jgi:hypothetical protein